MANFTKYKTFGNLILLRNANKLTFSIYFILFFVSALTLLAYYFLVFSSILKKSRKQLDNQSFKGNISIVVCGLNEYDNLKKNLPKLLEQCYKFSSKKIEVVFVNDGSTDQTCEFLEQLGHKNPQLKIINISPENKKSGKKSALVKGIELATGHVVVLTDADCQPRSKYWAACMADNFTDKNIQINLGYAPYNFSNSFVGWSVLYETTLTAIQYLSYAKKGMPYMGVGRNLAYRKKFFQQKQFSEHPENISSGDDDLFVNRYATSHNTSIEIKPEAHCYSNPPKSLKQWIKQKNRHLSTGKYYKTKHKLLLTLFALAQFTYVACFLLCIFLTDTLMLTLVVFSIKSAFQFCILFKTFKKLKRKIAVVILLAMELVQPLYYVFFFQSIFITNKVKWN